MGTQLQKRAFGATGIELPVLGYGTAALGKPHISREHAVRCLNYAIDAGITYLDTSPSYGSEPHIGAVMRSRRDDVFLATKIDCRRKESVVSELDASLDRLHTDHVDLIQIHAVNARADLEQTLAADGAIAALEDARSQGKTRFIGITGHARPAILGEALRRYKFDSVLCALGIGDHLISAPDLFLLPEAVRLGCAVIAMKVFGHGLYHDRPRALRYSLNLPGVALAIIGMDNVQQIDENIAAAADSRPLDDIERQEMFGSLEYLLTRDSARHSENEPGGLFWLYDTSVAGWKRNDEPRIFHY